MDLARTKNILILIFVLLNIFLGVVLVKELGSWELPRDTSKCTAGFKRQGVIVDCEIPDYDGSVGTLVYKKRVLTAKAYTKYIRR